MKKVVFRAYVHLLTIPHLLSGIEGVFHELDSQSRSQNSVVVGVEYKREDDEQDEDGPAFI